MKNPSRILGFLLVAVLVFALAACAQPTATPTPAPTGTPAPTATPAPVTLSFWHIYANQQDPNFALVKNVVANLQKEYSYITIQEDATEPVQYDTKIKTAMAANEAPDVFFSWSYKKAQPFVDAGRVLALDEYLDEATLASIKPGMLAGMTFNDKIYGLPYDSYALFLFCNKELFEKAGAKVPTTFDELLDAADKLRAAGIAPLINGGKQRDFHVAMLQYLTIRNAGLDAVKSVIAGESAFNQPAFVAAANQFAQLSARKTYADEGWTLTQPEARNLFKAGGAGMILDGSWAAGAFDAENSPVKGKVEVVLFPTVTGGKNDTGEYIGSALNAIMVSANAKDKPAAVTSALFIAQNFCKDMYQAGSALPAWNVTVDETKLPALFVAESKLIAAPKGNMDSFVSLVDAANLEDFKNAVMEFAAGKKTAEEFMALASTLVGKQ